MRTNLTPFETAEAARKLTPSAVRGADLAVRLAAGLLIGGTAFVAVSQRAGAAEVGGLLSKVNGTVVTSSICHRVDEVKSALFPAQHVVAFDFSGADAGKLKTAMDGVAKQVAPAATLVRLVLVPDTDEAIAFQFGTDGCHTVTLDLSFDQMSKLFMSAGVNPPFGATYYSMIGIPI